jgi:hypothetical protein
MRINEDFNDLMDCCWLMTFNTDITIHNRSPNWIKMRTSANYIVRHTPKKEGLCVKFFMFLYDLRKTLGYHCSLVIIIVVKPDDVRYMRNPVFHEKKLASIFFPKFPTSHISKSYSPWGNLGRTYTNPGVYSFKKKLNCDYFCITALILKSRLIWISFVCWRVSLALELPIQRPRGFRAMTVYFIQCWKIGWHSIGLLLDPASNCNINNDEQSMLIVARLNDVNTPNCDEACKSLIHLFIITCRRGSALHCVMNSGR